MNEDRKVPRSKVHYLYGLLYKFPISRPIFWGPNQLNSDADVYDEPSGWRNQIYLQVPRVVRFIYTSPENYDSEKWSDDETGDPGVDLVWRFVSLTDHYIEGLWLVSWQQYNNGVYTFLGGAYGVLKVLDGTPQAPFYAPGIEFATQPYPIPFNSPMPAVWDGANYRNPNGDIVTPL